MPITDLAALEANLFKNMMKSLIKILRFESLNSTNSTAKAMLQQGLINKATVIVAGTQTAGRGQMQTKWHDNPGQNLLFTLVQPKLNKPASQFFGLNMAVCLALTDALQDFGDIAIKWPNDIILNGKKVAGVLIENTLSGDLIANTCIGVGINVNQENWPEEILATSVKSETGHEYIIEDLLATVLSNLIHRLKSFDALRLQGEYQKHLLGFGKQRDFEDNHGRFSATVSGVDTNGMLQLLKRDDGDIRNYAFKEVRWLPPFN